MRGQCVDREIVRCSSAVRNAIEHDIQVNSGLSSCVAVCMSVIRDIRLLMKR
jgi:hypothetical protein